jgi:hypothetical protein
LPIISANTSASPLPNLASSPEGKSVSSASQTITSSNKVLLTKYDCTVLMVQSWSVRAGRSIFHQISVVRVRTYFYTHRCECDGTVTCGVLHDETRIFDLVVDPLGIEEWTNRVVLCAEGASKTISLGSWVCLLRWGTHLVAAKMVTTWLCQCRPKKAGPSQQAHSPHSHDQHRIGKLGL